MTTDNPAIRIDPHPSGGAAIAPADYLGKALFRVYLDAMRSVPGTSYDSRRRCQQLPNIGQLPGVMAALEKAGFRALLSPDLAAAPAKIADAIAEEREEAVATMQAAIDRIAATGLSPYPYQRDGIPWLALQDAALLGDEPGLGKTMQSLLAAPPCAPIIAVCPATIKGVWAAEARKWRPDLTPVILGGVGSFRWPEPGELVIINDDVLPRDPDEYDEEKDDEPIPALPLPPNDLVLIYDEAHRGKGGKKTLRGRRFLTLSRTVRDNGGKVWLLTGTPLVNRPPELKAVLDLAGLFGKAFGSWPQFVHAFKGYRGEHGLHWGKPTPAAAEGLRRVSLIRLREDVLPDLPKKTWQHISIDIEADIRSEFDEIAAEIDAAGFRIDKLTRAMLKEPVLFRTMSRIRECIARASIPAMMDLASQAEAEEERLVVFSAHRAPIDLLGKRKGWETITGDTPAEDRTAIVERFQAGKLKGIAGTIRAMGTGITLTASAHAVFVDLDWTPAGNSQAEDRLCRIGQHSAVFVTILVADHPLVERIVELLRDKKVIIDGSVTEAAKGKQTQASDLIAELEAREQEARAMADRMVESADERVELDKERAEQERAVSALRGSVIAGGYCLIEPDGKPLSFWKVDVPEEGKSKWYGWLFLKRQAGPDRYNVGGIRPNGQVVGKDDYSSAYVLDVLTRITQDPEAMARYGRELGVCGRCGLELTDDESRRLGIGPICRAKGATGL